MPPRKGLEPQPCCYLAAGSWPDGPLVPKAPPEAVLVQQISKAFRSACEARNLTTFRAIAKKAKISEKATFNLLKGRTWGDVPTIARIEMNLKIRLWVSQQNALGPPG